MDLLISQSDGIWHHDSDRQCWTRTGSGPVRIFNARDEAERYALSVRPTPAPTPLTLQGRGQSATDAIKPPGPISIATFTHTGQSNFIVHGFQAGKELFLVNAIGQYRGAKVLTGSEPVTFDIRADGAWTVTLQPIGTGGKATFSGRGDAVSDLFPPPSSGPWQITHDGLANFIVHLNCAGGPVFLENEIGPVDGSRIVQFKTGPCFWEVTADGDWSLAPR